MGGNGIIESLSLEKVYNTVDSILWRQSWRFIKRTAVDGDTLDIVRTVMLKRDEPYFRLRYEFTWVDVEPEFLRFIWHLQHQTRPAKGRSVHEVGYAPGYGMVVARHAFDASTLGYAAGMMLVGNPLATYIDTLPDGTSSHLASALMNDMGSGTPSFPAWFISFNPQSDIFPDEIAWIDTVGRKVPSLSFESAAIEVDTTNVLDSNARSLIARSRPVLFQQGMTLTMEYAVGRAFVKPGPSLSIPDVDWSEGTPEAGENR